MMKLSGAISRMGVACRMSTHILLGTGVSVALVPVTASLVGATEYGLAGAAAAWVSVLGPLAEMGLAAEIAVCERHMILPHLRRFACYYLCFGLLVAFEQVAEMLWFRQTWLTPGFASALLLLSAGMAINGLATSLCTRFSLPHSYSIGRSVQGVVTGVFTAALAMAWPTAATVLIGQAVGLLCAAAVVLVPLWKSFNLATLPQHTAGSSSGIPTGRGVAAGLGETVRRCALQIPILSGSCFFAGPELGQLVLATRIASMPGAVVGMAVAQIAQARLAQLVRTRRFGALSVLHESTAQLTLLSGAFFLCTIPLMAWVTSTSHMSLGWSYLGVLPLYVSIAPAYFLQAVTSPLLQALPLMQGQTIFMRLMITRFTLAMVPTVIATFQPTTPIAYALAYSAMTTGAYLLTATTALRFVRRRDDTCVLEMDFA